MATIQVTAQAFPNQDLCPWFLSQCVMIGYVEVDPQNTVLERNETFSFQKGGPIFSIINMSVYQ